MGETLDYNDEFGQELAEGVPIEGFDWYAWRDAMGYSE
jgi:hypothetical protein